MIGEIEYAPSVIGSGSTMSTHSPVKANAPVVVTNPTSEEERPLTASNDRDETQRVSLYNPNKFNLSNTHAICDDDDDDEAETVYEPFPYARLLNVDAEAGGNAAGGHSNLLAVIEDNANALLLLLLLAPSDTTPPCSERTLMRPFGLEE
jgi:hypothetical protein